MQMLNPEHHYIWTAKDVATYFNVSSQHVTRMAGKGVIPGIKLGKPWRFDEEEIKQWAKDQKNQRKGRSYDETVGVGRVPSWFADHR